MDSAVEKQPLIFLVDDDEDDLFFINSAIVNNIPNCKVKCYGHGKQLLEALRKMKGRLPSFILMDLNMPVLNGRETIKLLRQDKVMHSVPVVILSTSNNPNEIALCYKSGANNYFCKPSSLNLYDKIILDLKQEYIDKVAVS
jgi:CheY-like chemotaxis protein